MLPKVSNLFQAQPSDAFGEQFIPLVRAVDFTLEQIVSHGHAADPGHWYDQPNPEWVLLARGHATLKFEGGELLELGAGDFLQIPARLKHRVESCSQDAVWLALHYREHESWDPLG